MIELTDVSKTYGRTRALSPTNLTIPANQTLVIIGPSGCGKSTLLRIVIGLIRSDSGWVQFEGTVLSLDNILSLRQRMGFVTQDGGLFPHLTAKENVEIMARYLGWHEERIEARRNQLTALTQFPSEGLNRYPVQLSGGQRQRVSLMRALMLDPDLLLLDEPLGALDPMIRSELQIDLRNIFQALKKTVVMVTHDLGEAGFFGDRLALMRDGKIVQQGTLKTLIETPAEPFVSRFINAQRSPLTAPEESTP